MDPGPALCAASSHVKTILGRPKSWLRHNEKVTIKADGMRFKPMAADVLSSALPATSTMGTYRQFSLLNKHELT